MLICVNCAEERLEMMRTVERYWDVRNQKMRERATNPLHRQKLLLGESDSSDEDNEEDFTVSDAVSEAEDCFVNGRTMTLATFKKVKITIIPLSLLLY